MIQVSGLAGLKVLEFKELLFLIFFAQHSYAIHTHRVNYG